MSERVKQWVSDVSIMYMSSISTCLVYRPAIDSYVVCVSHYGLRYPYLLIRDVPCGSFSSFFLCFKVRARACVCVCVLARARVCVCLCV